MRTKRIRNCLISLAFSILSALALLAGAFYQPDQMLADWLYQSPEALDGNIFVIGIDERAMEDIGPYQTWGRDVMAMAIEALNADASCRPAVIGVDVLYTGESDPDLDAYLVEAAGACGNVVVASVANMGSELVTQEDGHFYMDDYAVLSYEEPFDALREVTTQGHINAMYDRDGVIRHAILSIDLPDGTQVPSFAYAIYKQYAGANGLPTTLYVPTDAQHRFYVDFSALPGGFYDGVSVADLLSGDFPAEQFANAIVLIGPYAPGLSDYVTTAIDRASLMYRHRRHGEHERPPGGQCSGGENLHQPRRGRSPGRQNQGHLLGRWHCAQGQIAQAGDFFARGREPTGLTQREWNAKGPLLIGCDQQGACFGVGTKGRHHGATGSSSCGSSVSISGR